MLLHGPPAGGKTELIKALASEAGVSFLSVDCSNAGSHWQDVAEKTPKIVWGRKQEGRAGGHQGHQRIQGSPPSGAPRAPALATVDAHSMDAGFASIIILTHGRT